MNNTIRTTSGKRVKVSEIKAGDKVKVIDRNKIVLGRRFLTDDKTYEVKSSHDGVVAITHDGYDGFDDYDNPLLLDAEDLQHIELVDNEPTTFLVGDYVKFKKRDTGKHELGAIVEIMEGFEELYIVRSLNEQDTFIRKADELELASIQEIESYENTNGTERPASAHYHANNNGNDVWQFADDNFKGDRVKGFHQTNAIKYTARYHLKHDTLEKYIEDLEKAKTSIDKLIEIEKREWTGMSERTALKLALDCVEESELDDETKQKIIATLTKSEVSR